MASRPLAVRVSDEQLRRWEQAARSEGESISAFIRSSVEARIEDRTSRAVASAVANRLLPEIERMIGEIKEMISSNEEMVSSNAGGSSAVSVFKMQSRPTAFDASCFDRALHTPGQLCPTCRGSVR